MELFRKQGEPLEAGVRALSVAKDARTASAGRKKHALQVVRNARARIAESLATPEPTPTHGNRSIRRELNNSLASSDKRKPNSKRRYVNDDRPKKAPLDPRRTASGTCRRRGKESRTDYAGQREERSSVLA